MMEKMTVEARAAERPLKPSIPEQARIGAVADLGIVGTDGLMAASGNAPRRPARSVSSQEDKAASRPQRLGDRRTIGSLDCS
jgi:hypothetical protein